MDSEFRRLEMAVTTYDHQRSNRKDHNPYALAQYLAALEEVKAMVLRGKPLSDALTYHFDGPLLSALQRASRFP